MKSKPKSVRVVSDKQSLSLRDLGEDEVIHRLTQDAPQTNDVWLGAGDDCAVVKAPTKGEWLVLKTDAVVENAHFESATSPRLVGRKALARVISDMAAMGAVPQHALVTLAVPAATSFRWVRGVYDGLHALAREFGVSVVGGETTWNPVRMLSVALTGKVETERVVSRSGGKVGDALFVTGRLGGSIKGHHLRFVPRLEQARWLTSRFKIHAMMDLSDGLARDLPRLAKASATGFQVNLDDLLRRRGCSVKQAWGDGEDYELLFAVAAADAPKLMKAWQKKFAGIPLTRIGELTVAGAEKAFSAAQDGWDPFTAGLG